MRINFNRVKNVSSEEVSVAGFAGVGAGYIVMGTGAIIGKAAVVTIGSGILLISTGVLIGSFIRTVCKEMENEKA